MNHACIADVYIDPLSRLEKNAHGAIENVHARRRNHREKGGGRKEREPVTSLRERERDWVGRRMRLVCLVVLW